MRKNINKFISAVCAVAMVVSSMTLTNNTVEAVAKATPSTLAEEGNEPLVASINPPTDFSVKGGTLKIDATWKEALDVIEGTQYYLYLDDATEPYITVTGTSATLENVPAGAHTVSIKAYYDGVFSKSVELPQIIVYAKPVAVTNLRVASHNINTLTAQWDYVENTTYKVETLDNNDNVVSGTTTDITTKDDTVTCVIGQLPEGQYKVRVTAIVNEENADAVTSDTVQVYNVKAADISALTYDLSTRKSVKIDWTVNNPVEGQTYIVYLDGTQVATPGTDVRTYTYENVSAGIHKIKVSATLDGIESNGLEYEVIVKGDETITKMDTSLTQVDTNGTQTVDSNWSYTFATQSADSYVGVDVNGDFVAYMPSYAGGAVDQVYQSLTGLEVGKTYTYTYTISTDVEGNNIPVNVASEAVYNDDYELKAVSTDGVTVTKKFTAKAETMKFTYTLGFVNNAATVKISKVTKEELQPIDATLTDVSGGSNQVHVKWTCKDAQSEQRYKIYLYDKNGEVVDTAENIGSTEHIFTNVPAGEGYTVKVASTLNGHESTGVTSDAVDVVTVLTSDQASVEGFQIKTNNVGEQVAFRTICKATKVGNQITANDGNTYTVASVGTIYTLDTNNDGYRKNDVLNASYTILNSTAVSGQEYTYTGAIQYKGTNRTYGYVATDGGVLSSWNPSDTDNTYYVRTMTLPDVALTSSIYARAFVVTTDGTIIYGKKTATISVAEVADYLYKNSKARNYTAHKYLFTNILSKIATTNPYYRSTALPYGWDQQLFTPTNPTYKTDGTLEDLNK